MAKEGLTEAGKLASDMGELALGIAHGCTALWAASPPPPSASPTSAAVLFCDPS
jgi:hypothetical protein